MRLPSRVGLLWAALHAASAALSMALCYYALTAAGADIYGERWGKRAAPLAAPWYFVPMLFPDGHRLAYFAWAIGVVMNATLVYYIVRAFERWRTRPRAPAG